MSRMRASGSTHIFFWTLLTIGLEVAALAPTAAANPQQQENAPVEEAGVLDQQAAQLYGQGLYVEAEPLLRRALAIREKALGPDHPDVATSLNNLTALYVAQSRLAEAEPLGRRALAIREKVLGPDHPDVATSLNNLAILYRTQGRLDEAEPLQRHDLAIREKALGPDHPDVATSLNNLAVLYRTQGRLDEAEPLLRRALTIREKALGSDHRAVANSLNNLAELYRAQGRLLEVEPLFRRALAIYEKALGPDHPDLANGLNNLALLCLVQGRLAEAEPLQRRALAIRETAFGPDHPAVAASLSNLAELYRAQSRLAEAEPLLRRALAIRETALGPDHPDVAISLNNLAGLYQAQSRRAEAEALFRRALAIREKAFGPDHPDVAMSLHNLAATLDPDQDQPREALAYSRRATDILGHRLQLLAGERSGRSLAGQQKIWRDVFLERLLLTRAVGGADAVADTFLVAQRARTSDTGHALAGLAARYAAGSDALSQAIRQRQDLAAHWQHLDETILMTASRPLEQRDAVAEAATRAEFTATTQSLDALDAQLASRFPAYAELSNPQPLTLAAAQALLAPDEALLVYIVSSESWLWVVRHDAAGLVRLGIGAAELTQAVQTLRDNLDPDANPGLNSFPAGRAYGLYEKVLAPAAALLSDVHHLMVVPDGALESLPFGVLVTKPPVNWAPERIADHRAVAWLVREYSTTVLPDVSSLRALRQPSTASQASLPFVGIGDPLLGGDARRKRGVEIATLFRGSIADVDQVRALPPLPETAGELSRIAALLGATEGDLYLGERASEPALRAAGLDRYRVVEFATHGLVSGDLSGLAEPALVLTPPRVASAENDGLLTASKIATLKLNAAWVVLSACNTAAGDGTPGAEGLSGLAKAFFYAGSRSVLVSHWPVVSDAAVKLTTGAFAALARAPGIGRAEALRRSEVALMDDETLLTQFAHPMMWGAFSLAGEGAPGR